MRNLGIAFSCAFILKKPNQAHSALLVDIFLHKQPTDKYWKGKGAWYVIFPDWQILQKNAIGMEDKNYTGVVPGQERGESVTARGSRRFDHAADAKAFFGRTENRLLDVNRWHELAGEALARFTLTDNAGEPVEGLARKGLLLKID